MENILILKSIYLDNYFYIFLLIIILTGNFNYFIPYFLLLIIHELGHAIMGIVLGYKLKKIMLYPLGGITIIDYPFNISLKKELLILVSGPLFQIFGYVLLKNFFPFIAIYHYVILIFNLLPIYPLDGGKIFNILCSYHYNFLKSFRITCLVSLMVAIFLLVYNLNYFNLNFFLILILIIIKIIKLYQKRFFYYNRFLLERHLYNYSFQRIKNIQNINDFYRDSEHYVNFLNEKKALAKYFKSK